MGKNLKRVDIAGIDVEAKRVIINGDQRKSGDSVALAVASGTEEKPRGMIAKRVEQIIREYNPEATVSRTTSDTEVTITVKETEFRPIRHAVQMKMPPEEFQREQATKTQ